MPRDPDVLGQPTRPKSREGCVHDARHLAKLGPGDARHRVEVHAEFVGMVQIVGADRVRVQLEARKIGKPRERGRVAKNDLLRGSSRRKRERHHLHPRRARGRGAF